MKNAIKVICFVLAFILIGTAGTWVYFKWDKGEYEFYDGVDRGTVIISGYIGESKDVVIPKRLRGKKVVRIDDSAFKRTDITSVKIGGNVTAIGKSAFLQCEKLKKVELDEGVRAIGDSVFSECTSLESVSIPSTLEKIGEGVFLKTAVKDLDFSKNENFVNDNGVIYNKDKTQLLFTLSNVDLTNFVCPDTVTSVDSYAFYGHSEMKSVKLSNNLQKISSALFLDCTGLKQLSVPESVVSIDMIAFSNCGLERVYIPSQVRKIEKGAFMQAEDKITVVTPAGSAAEKYAKEYKIKVENKNSL